MPPKRTPSNPRGPQRQNSTRDKKNPNNRKDPEDKILKIELNNGIKIPLLGLGTWKWQTYTASGMNNTERAVEFALENGYRHIDTDERYNNLVEIGRGLDAYLTKQARDNDRPVTRENLFLSCKLWGVSFKNVEESYNRICKQLGTTYLDCLYIGIPCGLQTRMIENSNAKKKKKENTGNDTKSEKKVLDMHPKSPEGDYLYDESISYIDTWKQCEKLIFADKVKTLGLANWNIDQINKVLQLCACKPQLVQAELSPLLQQKSLIQFCKERGIVVSAYGPQGSLTTASDGLTAMKKKMTAQLKELDPHAEKIEDDSPMLKTVMRLALKKKQMEENAAETAEGEKKVTIAEEPSNETPRQPVETAETTEEKPVETEELTETSETCIEKQPLESQRSVESSTLEAAETASTTTTTAPAKKSVRSRPPKKSTKKAGGRKRSISKEQQAIEDANQALTQTRRTSIADLETTRQNYGISNHNQNFNTSALKFNEEMKIRAIASSHNSLSSHVVSRWALQLGCILVQSSWEVSSIRNANKVFTFELKKKEMDTLNEMNKYHRSFQFDEFKGHKFYPFKNELEMMEQHAMELLKNEPLSRPMKSPTKGMDEMSINDENVKDPLERKFSTEDQIKQIARRESLKPGPSGRPVGQTRWK